MNNAREEWYDKEAKVAITIVDVQAAAQALVQGHLCGPTSAYFLCRGLAAVALLGAETSEADEVVSLQMKCKGPLGGLNVECTREGTLRGYTEKKLLEDFDGMGTPDPKKVLGEKLIQVSRTVPGRILAQSTATTLAGYFNVALQRNVTVRLEAAVSDAGEVLEAKGLMVEVMPDAEEQGVRSKEQGASAVGKISLNVSSRNLLKKLGVARAELRKTTPLKFACRCSAEKAAAMVKTFGGAEGTSTDVVCHWCGKIYTVRN